MDIKILFLSIIGGLLIISNTLKSRKILNIQEFTIWNKAFHILMIWLLPFLWYYWNKQKYIVKTQIMTKRRRQKLLDFENSGFNESGKGAYGGE